MTVLIGTTNPSKVERFKSLLSDCNLTFYTLKDLKITEEPEEKGRTPEENAIRKAKFYGKYFDRVICNDAGLYLDGLSLDDPRQPGWPLDSISLDRETLTYFVDDESDGDFSGENIILGEYRQRLVNFLKDALGLTEEKP